jgi:hypothetical protein
LKQAAPGPEVLPNWDSEPGTGILSFDHSAWNEALAALLKWSGARVVADRAAGPDGLSVPPTGAVSLTLKIVPKNYVSEQTDMFAEFEREEKEPTN